MRALLLPQFSDERGDLNSRRLPKSLTKHPKFDPALFLPERVPIRYASKDTRSWVNDRRDPFLTPYALRHNLAVDRPRPVSTQLVSQGDDPFVLTGPNTRYAHNDKLAYQLRSWHAHSSLDRKILEKAIQATVRQYAPFFPRNVLRTSHFLSAIP